MIANDIGLRCDCGKFSPYGEHAEHQFSIQCSECGRVAEVDLDKWRAFTSVGPRHGNAVHCS